MPHWSAPVRYAEADQQGIVFNAHYLTWADESCTAWFAAVGLPYDALLTRGLDVRVKASTLEWAAAVRCGEVVDADVLCERIGGSSFVLLVRLLVAAELRCSVRTTYVMVDAAGRPVRVPDDLRVAWGPFGASAAAAPARSTSAP